MTVEAWRRFRERVARMIEQAAQDGDEVCSLDDPDWASVITQEAAFLCQEGPAAYLAYVAELDAAAVRADLDRWLDGTLGNASQ